MEQGQHPSAVCKTYQESRKPAPTRERAFEAVPWRCRTLYNTAWEQRITLWRLRGEFVTRYQQEAKRTIS